MEYFVNQLRSAGSIIIFSFVSLVYSENHDIKECIIAVKILGLASFCVNSRFTGPPPPRLTPQALAFFYVFFLLWMANSLPCEQRSFILPR